MTETVKSVFVNYIVCALMGGFLEYAAPEKARKTLRVTVVAVMLVASLSPLLKLNFELPEFEQTSENVQTEYDKLIHTAGIIEKRIYSEMRDILINLGINEYEIYVKTTVDKDSFTVWLEEITIQVPQEYTDAYTEIENAVPQEYKQVLNVEKTVEK